MNQEEYHLKYSSLTQICWTNVTFLKVLILFNLKQNVFIKIPHTANHSTSQGVRRVAPISTRCSNSQQQKKKSTVLLFGLCIFVIIVVNVILFIILILIEDIEKVPKFPQAVTFMMMNLCQKPRKLNCDIS